MCALRWSQLSPRPVNQNDTPPDTQIARMMPSTRLRPSSIGAYYTFAFVRLVLGALFCPLCTPIGFGRLLVLAPMEGETGRAECYVARGVALGVS